MTLTPAQLDAASEGLAVMIVTLSGLGVNYTHLMAPECVAGLRAVVWAGADVRCPRLADVPDDADALAAAGGN